MDDETATLFPHALVESELGMIPKGWIVGRIGDLGRIVAGKTPSTKVDEYWGKEIPFITIPDLHKSNVVTNTKRYLSDFGSQSQPNQLIPKGATAVSCIASSGLVTFICSPSHTNQQINSIIPHKQEENEWVYCMILDFAEQIIHASGVGTVFNNLNKSTFSGLQILLPPPALRERFSRLVSAQISSRESIQSSSLTLEEARSTVLANLVDGTINLASKGVNFELTE